ncbi:MAG TPA: glycosyltransferase family 2 protein [Methanoregulaceae archaeon]|nr:glycosyltransferase family 2 protein [Methanoregulaceae archaeon]
MKKQIEGCILIKPTVAIIILNWNGWRDTLECLESLYQIQYPNYTVVLIDNGSVDDSLEKILAYCNGDFKVESLFFEYKTQNKPIKIFEFSREELKFNEWKKNDIENISSDRKLILIKNEKNYGFAEGNNIGIQFSANFLNPKYFLLLNNDTVVEKSFLNALITDMDQDSNIGFIGPKIYYYTLNNRMDILSHCGGEIDIWRGETHHIGDKEIDKGQYDEVGNIDYITGACLLVTSSLIKKIGLLNPSYFLYWEETDWCLRGKRAGYKIKYEPRAVIWHKGSQSGTNSTFEYYNTRNRIWFEKDNAPVVPFIIFFIYFMGYKFWRTLFSRLFFNDPKLVIPLVKGVKDGFFMPHSNMSRSDH